MNFIYEDKNIWIKLLSGSYLQVIYFYQFENVYYGIVTSLLQQNKFLLCKQSVVTLKTRVSYKVMWSESCCRPVGDQLGTDRQLIGDRLVALSWAYVYNNKKVNDFLETSLQPIGDQSASENSTGIICNHLSHRGTCLPLHWWSHSLAMQIMPFIKMMGLNIWHRFASWLNFHIHGTWHVVNWAVIFLINGNL